MQSTVVLFALFALFAAAFGVNVASIDDIPEAGILVTIRTPDNVYARLLTNQKLFVDRTDPSQAAVFQLAKRILNDGTTYITFMDPKTSNFVSAEMAGKKSIRATRPHARSWESFIPEFSEGTLTMTSVPNGKILAVQTTGTITANQIAGTTSQLTTGFILDIVQSDASEEVAEGLNFLRQAGSNIGGTGTNMIYPSNGAATYQISPVLIESNRLWKSFNLKAIANQMYLCMESGVFAPTCTDPSDVSTHFHFWEPTTATADDDLLVIADHTNRVAKINTATPCTSGSPCQLTFADIIDSDASAHFEVSPASSITDNTRAVVAKLSATTLGWSLSSGSVVLGSNFQSFVFTTDGHIYTATTVNSVRYNNYVYTDSNGVLMYSTQPARNTVPTGDQYIFSTQAANSGVYVIQAENGNYITAASTVDGSKLQATTSTYNLETNGFAFTSKNKRVVNEAEML